MPELAALLALWAAVYAATAALYFAQGLLVTWANRRHPERRIQKDRSGEARAGVEIRQSLKSLTVTSFCLAAGLWAQNAGWTLWPPAPLSWTNGAVMLAVSVALYDAWFYWGHRLMHTRALYRWHRWHHRSAAPTVWSTYSDSLPDAFAMQSYYLVAPLILPIPPEILILHRVLDHINGQFGHAGFEYFAGPLARAPWPMLSTTFHDQHHAHFTANYANFFSVWDRLCGTLHPEYDGKVARAGAAPDTRAP